MDRAAFTNPQPVTRSVSVGRAGRERLGLDVRWGWPQAELRKALAASGARVHEGVAVSKAGERIDAQGRLVDEAVIDQIAALVDELRALAEIPLEAW